jgi:hypothetical protein
LLGKLVPFTAAHSFLDLLLEFFDLQLVLLVTEIIARRAASCFRSIQSSMSYTSSRTCFIHTLACSPTTFAQANRSVHEILSEPFEIL